MSAENKDDVLLVSRLGELAARAVERGDVTFSRFLDPREQNMALLASKKEGAGFALSGTQGTERRLCAFDGRLWLDGMEKQYDWPELALEILWEGRFASLAHRDILGALLALGINRESTGDILVEDGRAVVWVLESIAPYIVSNFISAGRAAVKARVLQSGVPDMPGGQVKLLRGSVHSLRLDAVVAEAFELSREEAARAVSSGLVKLDYAEETKGDRRVAEGALVSVRGMGRARLVKATERTRRSGRVVVEFERSI
jgi:RNA-binding protein YlmH